jgi:hypothetical protein
MHPNLMSSLNIFKVKPINCIIYFSYLSIFLPEGQNINIYNPYPLVTHLGVTLSVLPKNVISQHRIFVNV